MSYLLEDAATIITAAVPTVTRASAGGFMYLGGDPEGIDPDRTVVLTDYAGPGPIETFGPGLPPMETPRLQLRVRDASFAACRDLAWQLWRVLAAVTEQTVNGTRYNRIQPVQSGPFFTDVDDDSRVRFAADFQVWKGPTT